MGDGVKPDQPGWLAEEPPLTRVEDPPRREPLLAPPVLRESCPLPGESFLAPVAAAFSRHEAKLTRYAARITGDTNSARDVVQDVFARLCREPPADLNGQLAPWLYAACRNRAIDVRRKDSRMALPANVGFFPLEEGGVEPSSGPASRGLQSARPREPDAESCAAVTDPSRQAAFRDDSTKVLRVLSGLPASQQEAVCLRFSCGLSYKEIAAVMELSVSHVGVLLHTAIAALRERMNETEPRP